MIEIFALSVLHQIKLHSFSRNLATRACHLRKRLAHSSDMTSWRYKQLMIAALFKRKPNAQPENGYDCLLGLVYR